MAALELGFRSTVTPIPPIVEHTRRFDAGVIALGLEHRLLNGDIIRSNFDAGSAEMRDIEALQSPDAFADEGLSVHVFEQASGVELLRFDMFADDPHYHYIHPGVDSIVVAYDEAASGPMWEWTVRALRERAADMLAYGGSPQLAAAVDRHVVAAAVDRMESVAKELRSGQAPN